MRVLLALLVCIHHVGCSSSNMLWVNYTNLKMTEREWLVAGKRRPAILQQVKHFLKLFEIIVVVLLKIIHQLLASPSNPYLPPPRN